MSVKKNPLIFLLFSPFFSPDRGIFSNQVLYRKVTYCKLKVTILYIYDKGIRKCIIRNAQKASLKIFVDFYFVENLDSIPTYRYTGIQIGEKKWPTKKIKTNFKEEPKMCVYEMGNLRIVDLSKILDPKTESRRCHLFRFNTGGAIPDFHTNMDLMSHLGTHCECPYHHDDNWPSVAELPLTTFLGRAVYVDFKETVAKRGHITAADLDREAGKVREGDIVIIDSSYKLYPFTPDTNTDKDQRLLVGAESAEWFKAHKVKAVGFGDGVSIEKLQRRC